MHAGQHISPTIKLIRPLAQGAMGCLWVAEHLALNTQVAVKFIAPAHVRDAELAARFRQEAHAAANLKSPHVAQVFDHGVTPEGELYIVMELLEGETLQHRLTRDRRLSLSQAVPLIGQVAKALSRAHKLGIIHRDIKPANLFLIDLEGEPFVKVLDFGIAKQIEGGNTGVTATARTLGTPLYMSPEQFVSAKHVDHRTDLWSLAVVTYQILTGRLPFKGTTVGALSVAVHAGEFPPPRRLRPELPASVDAWMQRALQPDATARFASALEMAEALDAAAGKVPRGSEAKRGVAHGSTPGSPADPFAMTAPAQQEERATPRASEPKQENPAAAQAPMIQELKIGAGWIRLTKGSILRANVEAIISPTGTELQPDFDGLSKMIHRAAGPDLAAKASRYGGCRVGGAVVTDAGLLPPPIRFVIHAVSSTYKAAHERDCDHLLRSACNASLQLAEENGVRSLAFPALGTGINGYALERAASISLTAAANHLGGAARSVVLIVFVLSTHVSYKAYAQALTLLAQRRS